MTVAVWSWREAIAKSDLEPFTRLVLHTLANHMNKYGEGCFPKVKTIADESGMSERSVLSHIKKAVDAGYLVKKKHGFSGQRNNQNDYAAVYPPKYRLKSESDMDVEADAGAALASDDNGGHAGAAGSFVANKAHEPVAGASEKQVQEIHEAHAGAAPKHMQELQVPIKNSPVELSNEHSNLTTTTSAQARNDSGNGEEVDVAAAIVQKFAEAHHLHFPETEVDRQPDDLIHAARWAEQGATPDFCFEVFKSKLWKRKTAKMTDVPLRWFHEIIPEQLKIAEQALAKPEKTTALAKPAPKRDDWPDNGTVCQDEELNAAWRRVRLALEKKYGPETFTAWLHQIVLVGKWSDNAVALAVPSKFARGWICQNYEDSLRNGCRIEGLGDEVHLMVGLPESEAA